MAKANPINALLKLCKTKGNIYVEKDADRIAVTNANFLITGKHALDLLRKIDTRSDSIPEGRHKYTHMKGNEWQFEEGAGPDMFQLLDKATPGHILYSTKLALKSTIGNLRILGNHLGYVLANEEIIAPLFDMYGHDIFTTDDDPDNLKPLAFVDKDGRTEALIMPCRGDIPEHLRPAAEVYDAPPTPQDETPQEEPESIAV